jgi:hypothetical protein
MLSAFRALRSHYICANNPGAVLDALLRTVHNDAMMTSVKRAHFHKRCTLANSSEPVQYDGFLDRFRKAVLAERRGFCRGF